EGERALLEAIAKLIQPMGVKGMSLVGTDRLNVIRDVDVAAVGCGSIGRRGIILVEVANVHAVLGSSLPVDASQLLLVGGEKRNLAAELSKRDSSITEGLVRDCSNLPWIAGGHRVGAELLKDSNGSIAWVNTGQLREAGSRREER